MSLAPYPAYKPSGVPWLGDVPAHWEVVALKWLTIRFAGGTPDKTKLEYWEDGVIPWINSGAVNQQLILEPSALITELAFKNCSAKWIPKGALVMALAGQGKTKGMVAQLGIETTCNQSMAAIIPVAKDGSRFLYWWLNSNYQNIRNMAGGDLRDGLNLELLGGISCPNPAQDEQTAIAQFLDFETGKIDALIAEQEGLIALLAEKRQATISHAVTKGLNPNAPMKNSGVAWLGDVPAHWEVTKLGLLTKKIGSGKTPLGGSEVYVDEGITFIRSQNVYDDGLRLEDVVYIHPLIDEQMAGTRIHAGDVLLNVTGASIGRTCIVPDSFGGGNVNQHVCIIRLVDSSIAHYVSLLMKSSATKSQIDAAQSGAAREGLNFSQIAQFRLAFPPQRERMTIEKHLTSVTTQLDTLTNEAQTAITLLKERRTALISAAVTGKIDVRGFT